MATNNRKKTSRRPSARKRTARRGNRTTRMTAIALCLVLLAIAALSWRKLMADDNAAAGLSHISGLEEVKTAPGLDEKIVEYKGMTLSFNPRLHIPNWVAWELTADETEGNVPRSNQFKNDPAINGCAETWDYSYSGYDRGHMAPAGDMKWDKRAMQETFYLTNICPQAKSLNTGAWKRLEEKCRQRARRDSAIVIVCGPVANDRFKEYIGDSRVAVPLRFFKVILSPYTNPPTGIGFIMPNGYVEGGMQSCAVSIDSVEAVTGHDFFSALPDDIEREVESRCNFNKWSKTR